MGRMSAVAAIARNVVDHRIAFSILMGSHSKATFNGSFDTRLKLFVQPCNIFLNFSDGI